MGERFGRYELLRRLGTGGMAEVFVAKTFGAEGFVKELVIKRILPVFNADPEFVRMFINEARLAARLQHANIVQIFDFNHVEGIYYIAMEWVDGLDLRSLVAAARRRALPLPLRMAVHVGVETLKGLHYAHARTEAGRPLGLVHRDISPHNLLVSFAGEVKIADFGIAKAAAIASATRIGAVKGKLAYMSPEQASGESVNGRSDLFSLGLVLWELLAGQRAYQAESEPELFGKVKRAEIPPLHPLNAEVPPELEAVLRRLLAPSPDDRYRTAAEALGDLSRFADVEGALQVAGHLRRLVPLEAGRDRRGETLVETGPRTEPAGFSPSPAAATRTRVEAVSHEAETDLRAPGPGIQGVTAPTLVAAACAGRRLDVDADEAFPPGRRSIAAQRHPDRRPAPGGWALAIGAAVSFVFFAVAAYQLVTPATVERAFASLAIQTEPVGASLWADGLPIGRAPTTLYGTPGARVLIRARWGGPGGPAHEMACVLGAKPRLSLRSPSPGSRPSPSTRPTASSRPALPPRPPASSASSSAGPRAPRTSPTPARKPKAGWATLDVVVAPWAQVRIDGEQRGQTPLKGAKLPAGAHLIEITNPALGKKERQRLRLRAGQHEAIRRDWTK